MLNEFEFTEKSIYNIIIITYILVGFLYIKLERTIPSRFAIIAAFCVIKMIFNYRKCTFSKLECKIRKVKREDGILGDFLDHVVNLRYSKIKYLIYFIVLVFLCFTNDFKKVTGFVS